MDVSEIRDRIVDVQVLRLGEVEDHPLNYKVHTDLQGAAMDGVVEEVGWAGIPLAYRSERNGGKLTYLDGHLRKKRFPNLVARVAITDLNDQEADLFLLTYDPIAAMAHESPEQLDALLRNVEASNAAVQALLAELSSKAGLYQDNDADIDFQRPDFSGVIARFDDSVEGKAKEDGNWFFVEYYGQEETFLALREQLKGYGAMATIHEIRADFFQKLLDAYVATL